MEFSGEPTEESPTSTPSPPAVPEAFHSTVREIADGEVSISTENATWSLQYRFDICCGEPYEAHQATIAKKFTQTRSGNVSLVVRTIHECQHVDWRVPAALASDYENGAIKSDEFVRDVLNTTDRTNKC